MRLYFRITGDKTSRYRPNPQPRHLEPGTTEDERERPRVSGVCWPARVRVVDRERCPCQLPHDAGGVRVSLRERYVHAHLDAHGLSKRFASRVSPSMTLAWPERAQPRLRCTTMSCNTYTLDHSDALKFASALALSAPPRHTHTCTTTGSARACGLNAHAKGRSCTASGSISRSART